MTNRTNALIVTLEENKRVDDAEIEALVNAIKCMRGVIDVRANVAHVNEFAAQMQEKRRIQKKVMDALFGED